MSINPATPSIVSMHSPIKNSRNDFSIVDETKKTMKNFMLAKRVSISEPHSPSNFQKALAELVGTYIFIFMGCASALVDGIVPLTHVGKCLTGALALMAVIYTLGHISGAHFNPAVTIALGAASRLPLAQVPIYVLSQLIGSTLACLTLKVLFHDQNDINSILTQYKSSTSDLEAIVWEFITTFILMFVISGVATDSRAHKALCGVAIGVTLLFDGIIAGPITGASMNPARSIGPAIVSGVYKNLWVYIVAPILGALSAILVYSLLRVPEPENEESTKIIHNDMYGHPEV